MTAALPIAGSLGLLIGILWAVRAAARRVGLDAEVQRKLVHVGLGLYCLTFPVLFQAPWQVTTLCAAAIVLLLVLRRRAHAEAGLGQALHAVGRQSYGDVLFAISVAILFYRSVHEPVLYVLPIAVMTLSDAAAALVGSRYGRSFFHVEAGRKSWEGVTLFFLTAWLTAMVLLLLMSDVPRLNVVLIGLYVAVIGAMIEADSWRGLDNLFVPVALHILLGVTLFASPMRILDLSLMLGLTLVAVFGMAHRLGLDGHVARAAALAFFVMWVTAGLVNLVFPVALFVAAVLVERRRPSTGRYQHLDTLFSIIGVALFWLVMGESLGFNAIHLYSLTFAAAGAVLLSLVLGERPVVLTLGVAAVFAALQGRVWGWGPVAAIDEAYVLATAAVILVCAAATFRWRRVFDSHRSAKVFGTGLIAATAAAPAAGL